MNFRGKLMLIGGNVDKATQEEEGFIQPLKIHFFDFDILQIILDQSNGIDTIIEIVTSASSIPVEIGEKYMNAFHSMNCNNVRLMHLGQDFSLDDDSIQQRIQNCNVLMFTGGDQAKLMNILRLKKVDAIILERFRRDHDFFVAGTSAGAMIMSELMIKGGKTEDALFKGTVQLGRGLGMAPELVIDTHFVQRGRFARLIESICANPGKLGIGLGENAAVLLQNNIMEVVGSNLVVVVDGSKMTQNNYDSISEREGICVENVIIHVIPKQGAFHLKTGKVISSTALR
jgi:cyanophycinase